MTYGANLVLDCSENCFKSRPNGIACLRKGKLRRRSTFAGNSALSPSDVIDFALLPAPRILAGNSFIVRCHVISK